MTGIGVVAAYYGVKAVYYGLNLIVEFMTFNIVMQARRVVKVV